MSSNTGMTDALPELDDDEQIRYGWQMTVPGMGEEGQRRLKAATVLVSRVGGVGGPPPSIWRLPGWGGSS